MRARARVRSAEAPRPADPTDLLREAPRKLVEFHHRLGKHFLAEGAVYLTNCSLGPGNAIPPGDLNAENDRADG